jgi:hypothetical protein
MTKPAVLGSRAFRAGLVVVVVAVAVFAVHVVRVHEATGEFRLTPSESPPRLSELGRHYVRSSSTPADALPEDVQEIGETPGGGELFGPRHVTLEGNPEGPINPPVIWVRDAAGDVWTDALVGGP